MRNLLIALLPFLLAADLASAGEVMVVRLRDLDLSTTAGASLAVQRINDAAAKFCSATAQGSHTFDVTTLKCRRDMARRAGRKLNRPNVSARQGAGGAILLAQAVSHPWLGHPAPTAAR